MDERSSEAHERAEDVHVIVHAHLHLVGEVSSSRGVEDRRHTLNLQRSVIGQVDDLVCSIYFSFESYV